MILTCPACSARYLIAGDAIGEQGRDVRCGKCGHNWTQQPVHDSLDELRKMDSGEAHQSDLTRTSIDDAVESFLNDEIPEGVRPLPEPEVAVSRSPKKVSSTLKTTLPPSEPGFFSKNRPLIIGLAVAVAIFAIIAYSVISMRASIMSAMPATKPVFVMLGLEEKGDSKTLVFDSVTARLEGDTLAVTGSLINLSASTMTLPPMVVDILDATGTTIETLNANIEQKTLNGEQSLELNLSFSGIPDKGEQARLRFVNGDDTDLPAEGADHSEEPSTTDEEGADNTPAQPEGETGH